MELDPSQFLAQGSSDDDSENEQENSQNQSQQNGNGPPILTSLGLTHINSVSNPFASYAVSLALQQPLEFLNLNVIFVSHLSNQLNFRIRMIQQMMTKVKYRVMVESRMPKYQPIVQSVICNSQTVPMLVVMRKTYIK